MMRTLLLVFLIVFAHVHILLVSSFAVGGNPRAKVGSSNAKISHRHETTLPIRASPSSETNDKVDRLLELVDVDVVDVETNGDEIQSIVFSLGEAARTDTATNDADTNFTAFLGNYNVTHVIPSKPNEKPVGGKWSRGPAQALLKTRRTLQHLLAPKVSGSVAEAVNVITLSALRDLFQINVILRGDAFQLTQDERENIVQERQTPGGLSPATVRANFDSPRIVVTRKDSCLLNLSVGPTSSVILDTPYCDDCIRIGKGSRGSWFVFTRCFDDEANDWKAWIAQRPVPKSKVLAALAGTFGIGVAGCNAKGIWRIGGVAISTLSFVAGTAIPFSSGGIEQDRDDDSETGTNE